MCITQHKNPCASSIYPIFCPAKTSFMLGTLAERRPPRSIRSEGKKEGIFAR